MKKKILLFYLLIFSNLISSQNIVINEIMSSNTFSIVDDDGTYQDWIELYNAGPTSINLSGYGLTDDSTLLFKWVFPNVTIDAGDYLLIWASENLTNCGSKRFQNRGSTKVKTSYNFYLFFEFITLQFPLSS